MNLAAPRVNGVGGFCGPDTVEWKLLTSISPSSVLVGMYVGVQRLAPPLLGWEGVPV